MAKLQKLVVNQVFPISNSNSLLYAAASVYCGNPTGGVMSFVLRRNHSVLHAHCITLPENIEDIDAAEKIPFSPLRARDISGPVILSKTMGTFINNEFATGYNSRSEPSDPRLSSYDCRGAISLHSVMQTNVPEPFLSKGKATHLNMPGGQWGQGYKYISDDLQNFHYMNAAHQRSSVE